MTEISNKIVAFDHLKESQLLNLFLNKNHPRPNISFNEPYYFPEDLQNETYFDYDTSKTKSLSLIKSPDISLPVQSFKPKKKRSSSLKQSKIISSPCIGNQSRSKTYLKENYFYDNPGIVLIVSIAL